MHTTLRHVTNRDCWWDGSHLLPLPCRTAPEFFTYLRTQIPRTPFPRPGPLDSILDIPHYYCCCAAPSLPACACTARARVFLHHTAAYPTLATAPPAPPGTLLVSTTGFCQTFSSTDIPDLLPGTSSGVTIQPTVRHRNWYDHLPPLPVI